MSRKQQRNKHNKQNKHVNTTRKAPSSISNTRKKVKLEPRTRSQKQYINAIRQHDITFGIGSAGTGKTYLAGMLAMEYITEGLYDKLVICRPAVPAGGEKLGFLPGDIEEKMNPYLRPIYDALECYWSPRTIQDMMRDKKIEIIPLAYMRGRTLSNTFIIADEMQNATADQLLMLMTRLGENSKMAITGDPVQSDINGRSCLHVARQNLIEVDTISFVEFKNCDVVRHPTVGKILNSWPDNGIENNKPQEVISTRKSRIA